MTTTKTTISISEGRRRIFDIAEEVQKPNTVYTLTADGKPRIVIMSAEKYESILERIQSNKYTHWQALAVAEKPHKEYGVSRKNFKKAQKRN